MNELQVAQIAASFLSRVTGGPYTQIPRQFYIGQLGSTNGTLYTAPADWAAFVNEMGQAPKAVIEDIWISNTDSADHTVVLYLVESGGSAANNRMIVPNVTVTAYTAYQITGNFVLEASGTIQGYADAASKVTVAISGKEWT